MSQSLVFALSQEAPDAARVPNSQRRGSSLLCALSVFRSSCRNLYLIKRLLIPNANERLGDLSGGAEDVKRHRFFRGVDWDKLEQRHALPPLVPHSTSPTDTSYFEIEPIEPDEAEVEKQTVPDGVFKVFG